MPVGQVTCTELFIPACATADREVLHKLGVVVGQDVLEREGEEEGGEVEEVLGRMSRMAPRGPSQGEAGGQIGERRGAPSARTRVGADERFFLSPGWGGLAVGV